MPGSSDELILVALPNSTPSEGSGMATKKKWEKEEPGRRRDAPYWNGDGGEGGAVV